MGWVWQGAAAAGPPAFEVSIEQGGRARPIVASVVHVERAPFVVVVRSPPSVLLAHASTDPSTWRAAVDGGPLAAMPGFAQTGIAEHAGNPDQAIFVTRDAPMAWTSARFDRCDVDPAGAQVCRRTVARVVDGPDLAALPEADLYFVFAHTRWTDTHERVLLRAAPVRVHLEGSPRPVTPGSTPSGAGDGPRGP